MMKKISWSFVALIFLSVACERANKTSVEETLTSPTPPLTTTDSKGAALQPPSLSLGNIVIYPKTGGTATLTVEVAKTYDERRIGLQGRENIPDNHGMWFVFDEEVQDPFWMKDTPVALDIVFVDKDYKIVDIIPNTTPNSELLLVPKQKYRYALEFKAGSAASLNAVVGDRVEFRLGSP